MEDPEGCNWTFEGNSQRKFFIAAIVLKHFPTKHVQDRWPDIVKDVMSQAGSMTVPYAM